jgi:hypothetical protein
MPLPSGESTQTPELKSAGGLASVFKSLTGGNRLKGGSTHAFATGTSPSGVEHLLNGIIPRAEIHGGPADNDKLFDQLKAGKTLADRKSAADGLRLALEGYPLSGVSSIQLRLVD